MRKLVKQDYINIIIIIGIFLTLVLLLTGSHYVFGSRMDWESQHWALPEYFRTLFYDTKNLFPSFAFNIGGGQNIFNFSYYGLFSPVILISYLFPFIGMPYFLIGSMILIIIINIILIYKWLSSRFDSRICFLGTLIFTCAAPLIFHSHRHIMFVDYMPFLILGLMGVDKYFISSKRSLLIISIFLIILTSYYYSVGAILAITFYAVFKYIEINKKINFKKFVKAGLLFSGNIIIACLMAAVLLFPTAYTLLNGRATTNVAVDLQTLLMPSINWSFFLYGSYSLGLTALSFFSLIENILSKKKERVFITVFFLLFLIFPVFVYLLNATMYISPKALIPFLPVFVLMISFTIRNLFSNRYDYKKLFIILVIVSIIMTVILFTKHLYFYILDFLAVLVSFMLYKKHSKKLIIIVPLIIALLTNCIVVNLEDYLVVRSKLKAQLLNGQDVIVDNILKQDQGFYRFGNQIYQLQNINRAYNTDYYQATVYSSISNGYYNNFYFNLIGNENIHRNKAIATQPDNILFNTYMGIKYVMTRSSPLVGYKLYEEVGKNKVYVNENVFPIGYASSNLISKNVYDKLKYPYNVEALISNIVVNKEIDREFSSKIVPVGLDYIPVIENLDIDNKDGIYYIKAFENNSMTINLKKKVKNKVILIEFRMLYSQSCSLGDTYIDINGVRNKLTCKEWKYHNNNYDFNYAISSNEAISQLDITFAPGEYEITDIKAYLLNYEEILKIKNTLNPFIIDCKLTKGDKIVGDIEVAEDGYFTLSVPYDKGFEILVDGKKNNYELVNKSFIGFAIKNGKHHIEITYTAPYLLEGKIISGIGFIFFTFILFVDRRKKDEL